MFEYPLIIRLDDRVIVQHCSHRLSLVPFNVDDSRNLDAVEHLHKTRSVRAGHAAATDNTNPCFTHICPLVKRRCAGSYSIYPKSLSRFSRIAASSVDVSCPCIFLYAESSSSAP